eukprot:TRINITY_DN12562_c0_g1_i1.p1 TRINITY_DN12562_c0_g1~~TRINITY_DN12562_c0_g1_i1.p1  ORF type:complete len:512 (+),score=128.70 TRINITY_DN12562_c0_g1_i1:125-1660(+)
MPPFITPRHFQFVKKPNLKEVLSKNDVPPKAPYKEKFFDQVLDHYNYQDNTFGFNTFKMRYLEDLSQWEAGKGPIFFYCGNEGPVTMFYDNSGYLTNNLRNDFKAAIVFAEHRYFGKSQPFGDQSYDKDKVQWLTTEQALADFVYFLKWYKAQLCKDCPLIAFGGSYGGMLASWLRMKFPNVVDGAIASSAPILYFKDITDPAAFYSIVTENYRRSAVVGCPDTIQEGFRRLEALAAQTRKAENSSESKAIYDNLNQWFKLCTPITNSTGIYVLEDWLMNAYTYMAMTNYPYPTDFLNPMPGWPANATCERLSQVNPQSQDQVLFQALRESVRVFYDYNNQTTCNEIYQVYEAKRGSLSSMDEMYGWLVLACGDMALPLASNGKTDMFPPRPFDYNDYATSCYSSFGMRVRYDWAIQFFGGERTSEFLSYSNIFFANGDLDPWSAGSPLETISSSLPAYVIHDAAHHLDLRPPNSADPQSVVEARNLEQTWIKKWINQKYRAQQQSRKVKA